MARFSYKDNPAAVIDKLLEYHSIEDLRAILNRKARRRAKRGNTVFEIATETYLLKRLHNSKLNWAVDQIADEKGIGPKTVYNHLTNFRNMLKSRLERLKQNREYNIPPSLTFDKFIKDYIKYLAEIGNPNPVKNEEDFEESFQAYIQRYRTPDVIF